MSTVACKIKFMSPRAFLLSSARGELYISGRGPGRA